VLPGSINARNRELKFLAPSLQIGGSDVLREDRRGEPQRQDKDF
jgi:hypothetical protein